MSRIAKIMFMLVGLALVANSPIAAQETPAKQPRPKASAKKAPPAKPVPDAANVSYGPHERNVLDLWLAKSDAPTPLLVFIHGGGFSAGGKEQVAAPLIEDCLKNGISVAAINYRLSPEHHFPDHYMDSARAIQFLRSKAKEYNLDPNRVAATGGSAGAGTSLWIAFHDDMADPDNADPVLRESTRLTCAGVFGGQTTYDPRVIQEIIGGRAHEHPALSGFYGLAADELDTPRAHAMYEAAAPISHATADDPPVWLYYTEAKGPLPEDARPGQGIHHINFGAYLKDKLDPLGVECVVRHATDFEDVPYTASRRELVQFLKRHFQLD